MIFATHMRYHCATFYFFTYGKFVPYILSYLVDVESQSFPTFDFVVDLLREILNAQLVYLQCR